MALGLGRSSTTAAVGPYVISAVIWEWQRDDGGFSPYHPEVSAQIEGAKGHGLGSVSIGKWSVDLAMMIQIRQSTGSPDEMPV